MVQMNMKAIKEEEACGTVINARLIRGTFYKLNGSFSRSLLLSAHFKWIEELFFKRLNG